MPSLFRTKNLLPSSPGGFLLAALPIFGVIAFALWLTADAAVENVRFAQTTGQLLNLISLLQGDAAKEPNFGLQAQEDLVATLIRRGQITGSGNDPKTWLLNSWRGAIRAMTVQPSVAQIETDVPAADCRHLALFFGRDAREIGLQVMEARSGPGSWRIFYDSASLGADPDIRAVSAACGTEPFAALALVLKLR